MKKFIYLLVAVMVLASCETRKEKNDLRDLTADSLRQVINDRETEINDLMGTFNEIQKGFNEINAAEGRVNVAREEGTVNRQAIVENMAEIQRTMTLNRQRIANLQKQLKEASISNTQMRETLEATIAQLEETLAAKDKEIEELRQQLAAKDIIIAEQSSRINQQSEQINQQSSQIDRQSNEIREQDAALHTAYYVYGTKKELKKHAIIDGREVLRTGTPNKDYFTKIDIRVDKVIKLYSKSAKIKTTHPTGSYTLERDSQKQYVLRITDPQRFWSVSKYLVVVVK